MKAGFYHICFHLSVAVDVRHYPDGYWVQVNPTNLSGMGT